MIKIPIEVGDVIYGGHWKNHKTLVKEIGKNEKGEVTINGIPLMRFRIPKKKITMDESMITFKNILQESQNVLYAAYKDGKLLCTVEAKRNDIATANFYVLGKMGYYCQPIGGGPGKHFDGFDLEKDNKIVTKLKAIHYSEAYQEAIDFLGIKVERIGRKSKEPLKESQGVSETYFLEDMIHNKYLYHATYSPLLKSIKQNGLNSNFGKKNWEDSKSGIIYLAIDKEIAISYAETSDVVPEEWLDKIVVLTIDQNKLDSSKFFHDSNVRNNDNKTIEYHDTIPYNAIIKIEKCF